MRASQIILSFASRSLTSTSIHRTPLLRPSSQHTFSPLYRTNTPSSSLSRLRYSSTSTPDPSSPLAGSTFKSAGTPDEPSPPSPPTDDTHNSLSKYTIPSSLEGVPHYRMTFTCKPCSHRSTHRISKHGYHNGTILIKCPSCNNRHLISDHLHIFSDKKVTLEDILKAKNGGEESGVRRGSIEESKSLGEDEEDIEFWDPNSNPEEGHAPVLESPGGKQ